MTALRRKLNSSAGASIFVGLLFFLLCALVGAVVLTAAMANGGRLTDLRAGQQSYLDVRSAARLVRDSVAGETFTAVRTVVDDPVGTTSRDTTDYTLPTGDLAQPLAGDAQAVYDGAGADAHTLALSGIEGMGTVTGAWDMDGEYAVTVALARTETGEDGTVTGARDPMTLTIPARAATTQTVSYQDVPYLTGYEADKDGKLTIPVYGVYTITTTVTTTTVTWQVGDIDKGAKEVTGDAQG